MIDYILLKQAERYLMRMQTDDKIRIINALDTLISNPSTLDIKSLKGRPEFRLRVGKYRILFRKDREKQVYIITAIGSRGDVYK
ncbi:MULTISPECIES: type II toxin-antitoxin system RelE/ParE family toxin [unclassified Moorena]|uniref:type II toxin-antitoxin system RelE family toxin n=1 Tax=unclassified Moorena TaxID=2683338 RepID=UPI0013FEFDA2|nr:MULTISPECIES: type II toxin-antitoxin system RelE/ParE family toxin [unclassified Moorena]NEO15586.1 type II toxin-antitoxin system RelE/ParE family toxin [Moorena sp. SIO3E8]NEQ01000.1 type II toxin-antitoxin system RelE/ParE family toxin [Moorena sp. SIO3F7]